MSDAVVAEESNYDIIVDFVGKHFKLDEFNEDLGESVLAKWELGGLTDPVGQIAAWFYNKIAPALNALGNSLSTYMNTLISPIRSEISSITEEISNVAAAIRSIPSQVEAYISSIESEISSIFSAVESLGQSIASIPSYVVNAIQSSLSSVTATIQSLAGTVSSIITYVSEIPSQVSTIVSSVVTGIESAIAKLPTEFESIVQPLYGLIESLPERIITTIESTISSVTALIEAIPNEIKQLLEPVYVFVKEIPTIISSTIENAINGIVTYIGEISKAVSGSIAMFGQELNDFLTTIRKDLPVLVAKAIGGIENLINKLSNAVTGTYTKLKTLFGGAINNILTGLNEVKMALSGFINPLTEIKFTFTNLYNSISSYINAIKDKAVNYYDKVSSEITNIANSLTVLADIKEALTHLKYELTVTEDLVTEAITTLRSDTTIIIDLADSVVTAVSSRIKGTFVSVVSYAKAATGDIKNAVSGFVSEVKSTISTVIANTVINFASGLNNADFIKQYNENMGNVFTTIIEGIIGLLTIEIFGELLDECVISLEFLGIGGQIISKIGKAIGKLPKQARETIADFLKDVAVVFSFWAIEPIKYQYYKLARNLYPIEIPSLGELTEITRRKMPTKKFDEYYKEMTESLQYRGYQDWTINAWCGLVSEENYVTVKDRFGYNRKFPTTTLYELPTVSDLCRMMVKDLFYPEDPLPHFEKAMLLHGVIPDIAKMYYMLHFRYPAMDVLFKFICRAAAGYAWVTEKPTKYEDLGYEGKSPVQLNNENWKEAVNTLKNYISYIIPYSKWHDYSPFAWVKGFTADRLIVVDMMAKLPDKIDARWMYKWSITDDTTLYRIVLSHGYHPNFVKEITQAEILNVVGESRTLLRSGLTTAYKYGLIDDNTLESTLSNLSSVEILGESVTIKYLAPEIDMITKRAKYDRAYELIRYASSTLSRLYYENVISEEEFSKKLTETIKSVGNAFSLNLTADSTYIDTLTNVVKFDYQLYTIGRVRIWIRYLLYRLMERFAEGYVKKSEINDFIQLLAKEAKLTEPEIELLKESAYLMYDFFVRKTQAEAILRRLARGVITEDKAKAELKKLGLDEAMINAMIEEHVKLYTFSVDHLITMSEYVPVDTKFIEEKAKLYGMPTQELKLLPAYKVAKDVSSYLQRYITELIDDYEYGLIDKRTLEKLIDQARTLNGEVKKLGVDWIVIDDLEKQFIIQIAEMRRKRHELMEAQRSR